MDILDGVYYGCVGIFMFVVLFQILEQTCCISCFNLDHSIPKNHRNNEDFGQDFELERLVWMAECSFSLKEAAPTKSTLSEVYPQIFPHPDAVGSNSLETT